MRIQKEPRWPRLHAYVVAGLVMFLSFMVAPVVLVWSSEVEVVPLSSSPTPSGSVTETLASNWPSFRGPGGNGVVDGADSSPLDNMVCSDTDGDTCEDCSSGYTQTEGPGGTEDGGDGWDYDGDGACDAGDTDDDNDGALDDDDTEDNNADICSDDDGDTCDCIL